MTRKVVAVAGRDSLALRIACRSDGTRQTG